MQYDYCAAYLDMFNGRAEEGPGRSRRRTRSTRSTAGGTRSRRSSPSSTRSRARAPRSPTRTTAASSRASWPRPSRASSSRSTRKAINLTWQNLETVQVNYYLMDVELLFSRNPFVQQSGGQFAIDPAERDAAR